MKRLALIALSLSLALPHFASAEDNNDKKKQAPQRHHAGPVRTFTPRTGQPRVHTNAQINPTINANRNFSNGPRNAQFHPQINAGMNRHQHNNPRVNISREGKVNATVNTNVNANNNRNFRGNGDRNNSHWNHARVQQVTSQRRWSRDRHDRNWYRSHYSRFARFGGGYYYWDSGFWYPAYGYDPYFSTYTYDAPVYGYNNLDPAQVIANVQSQLQQSGYYQGELDGLFGPMTRQALLNFQADNGLEPTGQIDEPTLNALGLQ